MLKSSKILSWRLVIPAMAATTLPMFGSITPLKHLGKHLKNCSIQRKCWQFQEADSEHPANTSSDLAPLPQKRQSWKRWHASAICTHFARMGTIGVQTFVSASHRKILC